MAEAKIYVPTTDDARPGADLQPGPPAAQAHIRGRRRVSIYVCWSFPGEANRDISELDNRFSTMTEVRRVEWPFWEGPEWSDPMMFQQGIAGALELFFRAWMPFQQLVDRGHRTRRAGVPAGRSGRLPAADRRTRARRYRHAARLRARSPVDGAGSLSGGNRRGADAGSLAKAHCWFSVRTMTSEFPPT